MVACLLQKLLSALNEKTIVLIVSMVKW